MMSRNPNAAQNPQMRMMKYLPLLFVVFFIRFPAGVLLYYAMSNVCRIVQQDAMYRFDPKVKALVPGSARGRGAHPGDRRPGCGSRQATREGLGKPPAISSSSSSGGNGGSGDQGQTGASSPPPSGRSRFRDLLSAATAQQATSAKSLSSGGTGNVEGRHRQLKDDRRARRRQPVPKASAQSTNGDKSTNGNKSSASTTNGKPAGPGQSRDRKPPPKGGHRTNRKRRGR